MPYKGGSHFALFCAGIFSVGLFQIVSDLFQIEIGWTAFDKGSGTFLQTLFVLNLHIDLILFFYLFGLDTYTHKTQRCKPLFIHIFYKILKHSFLFYNYYTGRIVFSIYILFAEAKGSSVESDSKEENHKNTHQYTNISKNDHKSLWVLAGYFFKNNLLLFTSALRSLRT